VKKTVLIMPGLPRCATTTFANLLRQNPAIYMPEFKEPHSLIESEVLEKSFSFEGGDRKRVKHGGVLLAKTKYVEQYASQLNVESIECVVDASTLYSSHLSFMEEISDVFPGKDYKFLISIRDPWARALSHYKYSQMRGEEPRDLSQALTEELEGTASDWLLKGYALGSRYDFLLRGIIDKFGIDSVRVFNLHSESVINQHVLNEVNSFLGLAKFDYDFNVYSNSSSHKLDGVFLKIRILARKLRSYSPQFFDNIVTRRMFESFISLAPRSKLDDSRFELDKELFQKCFEMYGEPLINDSELNQVLLGQGK
jgi:hypothetical protein